ncbi:DUF1688-domain-containing protein [Pluteus cervinus]|uniref:DUF1688-domain-containing protein n=1 Tax=Pluteus cervinus TaxID=181527 RepID=A0ACD3APN6_9AGAR|nr:DUF1688-domain-containing protein [Pluteus cervinus]
MNLSLTTSETAAYLRTLPAIRERCSRVFELAKAGKLQYFDYHGAKEQEVADFCIEIMKRDYSNFSEIPPHGRWRHLDAGSDRIEPLLAKWTGNSTPPDTREQARRLVDLFLVSVLLDAGAGSVWTYTEKSSGKQFSRSEGLGVASFHMFESGFFSSDPSQPHQVDAQGLSRITVEKTAEAMQVGEANPMVGLEGRTSLLVNLSKALSASPEFFGTNGRPGNIVDFLETHAQTKDGKTNVPLAALWSALIDGLNPIWPSRLSLGGIALGDVWPSTALAKEGSGVEAEDLVPFHKLTQWLTYSLIEIFQKVLQWNIDGIEEMTGLPEYRNGGLLVDLGVLSLKPGLLPVDETSGLPRVPPSHPAIVEWRAMTVIELDRIADIIRKTLSLSSQDLSLAQVLESATWKGGREIAKSKRPATGGPPIEIESDGTVF